jgi:hypothetical protein
LFEVFLRPPFGQDPIFERVNVLLVDFPSSSSVLPQQCSLEGRFVVASKEASLESKERDVQLLVLLVLVFVSKNTRILLDGSKDFVVPGPN